MAKCLESEFKLKSQVKIQDYKVIFRLGNYEIIFKLLDVKESKEKGPYVLDKLILDKLQEKGFNFDKNRSQYIKYCYDI